MGNVDSHLGFYIDLDLGCGGFSERGVPFMFM